MGIFETLAQAGQMAEKAEQLENNLIEALDTQKAILFELRAFNKIALPLLTTFTADMNRAIEEDKQTEKAKS